jgi:hypothetical protein
MYKCCYIFSKIFNMLIAEFINFVIAPLLNLLSVVLWLCEVLRFFAYGFVNFEENQNFLTAMHIMLNFES